MQPAAASQSTGPRSSTTPKISEVQRELAKFLEDFEAVKYLVEDDKNITPPTPTTSSNLPRSRQSIYDNVPFLDEDEDIYDESMDPDPSSSIIPTVPEIRITNPTLDKQKYPPSAAKAAKSLPRRSPSESQPSTSTASPPTRDYPSTSFTTFPRSQPPTRDATESPTTYETLDHKRRSPQQSPDERSTESPCPLHGSHDNEDVSQTRSHGHVKCKRCGDYLCKSDVTGTLPIYCTLPARCLRCKQIADTTAVPKRDSLERDVPDEGSWRSTSQQGSSRVRFVLDDYNGDKVPLSSAVRWGGSARVVPMKTPPVRHSRKRRSRVRIFLVTLAIVIIVLSIIGIVVAVTCASILSALQASGDEVGSGCNVRAYKAHLTSSWVYTNTSCDSHMNATLMDVTKLTFIRASKVYEALLDAIFRGGSNKDVFDFTKVDKILCTTDEVDAWISFKIFWKNPDKVPQPQLVLQEFLGSLRRLDTSQYNISSYSISIEGYRLPKK